jgi:hypothetical protein
MKEKQRVDEQNGGWHQMDSRAIRYHLRSMGREGKDKLIKQFFDILYIGITFNNALKQNDRKELD